jgi:hypothetical protein
MNQRNNATAPPAATNSQTGGLYVLALPLCKPEASNARTENLYSHNNPKAANNFVVWNAPAFTQCKRPSIFNYDTTLTNNLHLINRFDLRYFLSL